MQLKGSQIILECLKEQKVDTVFGYPGGQIMPLYDALYDYENSIKHILTCHEQGATHAADGYARSTGKVGVCFATSGPGATNTVTGIATAYMDSVPLIVITGQVPLSIIGKDSFQEVDITGITLPITKHNYFVKSVDELAACIRKAFHIATNGRPGPVLIDVPKNILVETADYVAEKSEITDNVEVSEDGLTTVAKYINNAKKPVIYAGGGIIISEASCELSEFAQKSNIPVLNTLMGLGTFPRTNPLSLGMVGMHGFKEANLALYNSDLVIAIGARFSDRVTGNTEKFAKNAVIIHIDIDESEVGKNIKTHHSIIGDIKDILTKLTPMINKQDRTEWVEEVTLWRSADKTDDDSFCPNNIIKAIHEVVGDDAIISTEVGQHQMWTAQRWPFMKPRTFISSGGLGTMGFGLGAAIGAQIGNPDKRVIHIAGDGSFRMNFNELATVSSNKLPIITIVLKNNTLGMVRQWQTLFFNQRYSATDLADVIDYVKLVESFGLTGNYTRNLNELKESLNEAVSRDRATVIICDIEADECVFPIVPPGEAINNQVLELAD